MNEYKFIPTPVFRDPILRYWIFLKGKILPIGYLVEDIGGVEVIVFKKENLALTDDIFKKYLERSSTAQAVLQLFIKIFKKETASAQSLPIKLGQHQIKGLAYMQRKGSASQQCEFNNQLLTPR